MRFLYDTCAICESESAQPNQKVLDQLDAIPLADTFLSCITIGEIQRGIAHLSAGRKKQILNNWLQTKILPQYHGRILPIELTTTTHWATMMADLEHRGIKMPLFDSLIAATALVHGLTLVTRNEKDFAHCGIHLFNPWR